MNRSRPLFWMALVASAAGCFNPSSYTPVLTSSTAGPEGADLPLGFIPTGSTRIYVAGFFFVPGTTLYLDGRPQPTTYLAASPPLVAFGFSTPGDPVLQVDLPAAATNAFGSFLLTAMGDGSLMSAPLQVFVIDARFKLTDIAPRQLAVGSPATTLTLTGTGFNASAQVFWNGSALATTLVSSTRITVAVPAPLLAVPGDATVEIREKSCRLESSCEAGTRTGIVTIGTAALVVAQAEVSGLAWDATHALLFTVSQRSSGSVVLSTLDPRSGAAGAGVTVEPGSGIAVSAGDRFLYVASTTGARRYSLPGLTGELDFSNLYGARVIAAPDSPETAAFSNGSGLRVLDGSTLRPNSALAFFNESIAWGFDSSRIYGIASDATGVQAYAVDAAGVTATAPLGSGRFPIQSDLAFDRVRRRIYAGSGENVDEQGLDPRPFAIDAADQCKLALDAALGKAFFACSRRQAGVTVRSFDLQTQQQISTLVLSGDSPSTVLGVIRWGRDGLAIAVSSSLYLYSGQFVQ